jgi:dTDP-4-dehydrorhamnose 3,5-epimerase
VRFHSTAIEGALLVELEILGDERGGFARTFCEEAFAAAGAPMRVVQANLSRNPAAGTLRGMHYQSPPHAEAKLVQCVRGRIFDAALDLRPQSATFGAAASAELGADGGRLFFIPAGCAHGFLTLEDDSDVLYLMGAAFAPQSARGVRWNDPAFAVPWPRAPAVISARDAGFADFRPGPGRG